MNTCLWKGFLLIVLILGLYTLALSDNLLPGDVNSDQSTDISDAVYLINFAFSGGPPPASFSVGDVNNDCSVDISDAIRIILYAFDPMVDTLFLGCVHEEFRSDCFYDRDGSGEMILEVNGYDLTIYHNNANYQCGLGYLVDYQLNGDNITALESDTGALADCYCWFDLSSTFYNLSEGDYTVTLIGIEGDTVCVGQISVPGEGAYIADFFDSGCIETAYKSPQDIEYSQSADTLIMVHHDAFFNCGALLIVEFEQVGDTLRFTETNTSDDYAYCTCYFEVTAKLVGLPAGQYIAEIYHNDPMDGPISLVDRRTIELTE